MTRVHVALGGNVGERLHTLAEALRAVDVLPGTRVLAVSRVYESESWPDPGQPAYANAVAVVETSLQADEFLRMLKEVERESGREPGPPNAPRPMDLDIVLFGDEEWEGPELTIPHPRLLEREFVVAPLLEVDSEARLPDGTRITTEGVRVGRITAMLGVLPGFAEVTRNLAPRTSEHDAEDWVEVAHGGGLMGRMRAPDPDLIFKRTIIEQEGIPYAWDPYPPDRAANPYGFNPVYRLLVPASQAERARRVLREVQQAPPQLLDEENEGPS